MQDTINYLNSKLNENDTLVIGLSGGPDSMCLLDILLSLNIKLNIIAAHINHNIREESDSEADFVTSYCEEHGVTCEYIKFTKKSDTSNYTEEELREKRYSFYKEMINKYNAKYLLTAHHGDDLTETILMRITRGSNLKGYCGFPIEQKKESYEVLRPLIFVSKSDIENYNKKNNIPYVIDKTNFSQEYTRNRYRMNILPHLKEEDPYIHKKYLKYSMELSKYYNYVNNEINKYLEINYINNKLNITSYNDLDPLLREKIIEEILNKIYKDDLRYVTQKHIKMILDLIKNKKPNLEIYLPQQVQIIKEYNSLVFKNESTSNNNEYRIELKDKVELSTGIIEKTNDCDIKSNYYIRLNSSELKLPLYIRTRNNGDKMLVKNLNGSKLLKDIFIDSKLPIQERNTFPVVTDANDTIIWLPGLKKSKFDKEKSENYDIILRYIKFNDEKGD